jgi:hypothetical protein
LLSPFKNLIKNTEICISLKHPKPKPEASNIHKF